jgi:hypothetical protein
MILIKRRLAIGWLVLTGLTALFLIVGYFILWPFQDPFWHVARAFAVDIGLMGPAIRYLQRTPADRTRLRELRETDQRLDAIERNGHV